MLLTTISQQLQDHKGRHIDTFGIYGRLLLQDNCSVATLAQTLLLNGQDVQASQAYQMEQDALVQIAIANSSNTQLLIALIWAAGQANSQLLDSWFSAAIITYPINLNAQPTTSTASTQPTTSTLTSQPPTSVSVGLSPQPQQAIQIINIIQKNDKTAFDPPIVMITKGTKIVWKNTSADSHTVTPEAPNAFTASSSLAPGQTFQWIPTTAGTYAYHCSKHSYMKAIVVVT
jgi:plastocyanin